MEIKYVLTAKDKSKYKNINSFLVQELQLSNRLVTKLINKRCIFLNNINCDTRKPFNINDILTIDFNFEENNNNMVPTKMSLDIVYEDDWLLLVNKPAGIAIHPSILHYYDSLSNGIKYYFDSIGLKKKIRPVNRLDFNTSRFSYFCKV